MTDIRRSTKSGRALSPGSIATVRIGNGYAPPKHWTVWAANDTHAIIRSKFEDVKPPGEHIIVNMEEVWSGSTYAYGSFDDYRSEVANNAHLAVVAPINMNINDALGAIEGANADSLQPWSVHTGEHGFVAVIGEGPATRHLGQFTTYEAAAAVARSTAQVLWHERYIDAWGFSGGNMAWLPKVPDTQDVHQTPPWRASRYLQDDGTYLPSGDGFVPDAASMEEVLSVLDRETRAIEDRILWAVAQRLDCPIEESAFRETSPHLLIVASASFSISLVQGDTLVITWEGITTGATSIKMSKFRSASMESAVTYVTGSIKHLLKIRGNG